MSIGYDLDISSEKGATLKANFSGIQGGKVDKENLSLSIFAFKNRSAQRIFSFHLNFSEIQNLYHFLNEISLIRDSENSHSASFIESTKDIKDILKGLECLDLNTCKAVLEKCGDKKVQTILESLSGIELEDLSATFKKKHHESELVNLEKLLELEDEGQITTTIKEHSELSAYVAGQPEKIFQNWIEKNLWIFGVEYIQKHDARKIGISSEADCIMESMDGFLDLIELKRPSAEILKYDSDHKSYYPHSDLSLAIGQCLKYLDVVDNYKLLLQQEHKVKIIRPRVKLIIGRTREDLPDEEFSALRMLNMNLNHVQVISYDYLLSCGRKLIESHS